MNKILNGYNIYVVSNGNVKTIKTVNEDDLKEINNLKELLVSEGIYSIKAYDNYINYLCDNFKIECCYTCNEYVFLDDLSCCNGCDEYICNSCKENGCNCSEGIPDEDEDENNINCYYL